MKNVLVVSAMPQETEYIAEYLKDKPVWEKQDDSCFFNRSKDIRLDVKILGVGKVNAAFQTADAINEVRPDLIVNIGVAGGLADDLDKGAVAIGRDYVQVDMKTFLPENKPFIAPTPRAITDKLEQVAKRDNVSYRTGRIATGDFVLYDEDKRKAIKEEYDPIAFDMETAAVAQVATAKNIDFVGIRSFSDMANSKTLTDFKNRDKESEKDTRIRQYYFKIPAKLIIDYLESEEKNQA